MDDAEVLERLVRAYSPSGRESAAVRAFVRIARDLGYGAAVDAVGNGVATLGTGRPELLFLGHIDTVEGERPVRWARGRLHGRGVVDAKGALAAALLAGDRFEGPGRLRIVAAVGEETDSRGARHLLVGRRPDAVIAGEPSGWSGVTVGYKGDLRVEATFGRERHHYSSPFPTAGDAAVSWASAVGRWACDRSGGTPYRSVTAKVVELSTGPLGDDETARVTIDVRLPPGTSVRAAWSDLPRDPGHPRLRVRAAIDPCEPGAQDPVARAFLASIREEGARPTVWKKAGTSDLNLAIGAWAVPGAAYGPGDSRLDHTANESLALDELLRSVRVLRRTFRTVASGLGRLPTPRGPGAVP